MPCGCHRAHEITFLDAPALRRRRKHNRRAPAASTASKPHPSAPCREGFCRGRTHALLIQTLPSHEHLHVLAEREGPVVLAEAVQQLGVLVVRVLVTDWKKDSSVSVRQSVRDRQSCAGSAGRYLQVRATGDACDVLLCVLHATATSIPAFPPQIRWSQTPVLVGQLSPAEQTLAKLQLESTF